MITDSPSNAAEPPPVDSALLNTLRRQHQHDACVCVCEVSFHHAMAAQKPTHRTKFTSSSDDKVATGESSASSVRLHMLQFR